MQTNQNSLIGKTLRGKYQVTSKLAQGGQSNIYYAKDITSSIDKRYIVKQFAPIYESDSQLQKAKELFNREAIILQKLGSHSQIPQIFDYFAEKEQFFLVQEFVDGQNLQQELDDKKYLTEAETIDILRDILGVLRFVHLNHYIHRDIKPSNLIRNKCDRKIYLIDFGAVKEKIKPENFDPQGNFTRTVSIGTTGYTPNEQKLGQPEFCSDIYALGMVAIQALTGVHPSKLLYDRDGNPIWREHLPTSQHNRDPKFLDLIDRMVRCDYKKRYQSSNEVLQDLNNLTTSQATPATTVKPVATTVTEDDTEKTEEKRQNMPFSRTTLDLGPVIAAIVTALVAIFLAFGTDIFKRKYVAYENSDYGIELEHPENWSIQEEEDFLKPGIIFLSPQENDADEFQEKVTVSIENLPQPLSLNEYTQQATKQIEGSNEIIEPAKATTFANKEGRKIIYQEKNGNKKRMEVWMLNKQKAYIATYTAEVDKFDKFLKQADKIVQSITINK